MPVCISLRSVQEYMALWHSLPNPLSPTPIYLLGVTVFFLSVFMSRGTGWEIHEGLPSETPSLPSSGVFHLLITSYQRDYAYLALDENPTLQSWYAYIILYLLY